MKKEINGIMYDTNISEPLAEFRYESVRLRGYFMETLYKTQNGDYFLHGLGDKFSPYWGEKLVPMTQVEAMAWSSIKTRPEKCTEFFSGKLEEWEKNEKRNRN